MVELKEHGLVEQSASTRSGRGVGARLAPFFIVKAFYPAPSPLASLLKINIFFTPVIYAGISSVERGYFQDDLRVSCNASASAISFVNEVSKLLASDLETFKEGFRNPLSIKLMYVGCKLAFSARDSWDNAFAFLCALSTRAKASAISKRRI
jgi:hypothetical protein